MKRFTETEKWNDPWFRKLKQTEKLFWIWICDRCDHAGIIDIDWELASFQIGSEVSPTIVKKFDGRIEEIDGGKYHISKFIIFQYPNLSEQCKPHVPVFNSLRKHNLIERYSNGIEKV